MLVTKDTHCLGRGIALPALHKFLRVYANPASSVPSAFPMTPHVLTSPLPHRAQHFPKGSKPPPFSQVTPAGPWCRRRAMARNGDSARSRRASSLMTAAALKGFS